MTVAAERHWRRSSLCSNEACVELASFEPGVLGVRDSKNGFEGPVLTFSVTEFTTFVTEIKEDRLDLRP